MLLLLFYYLCITIFGRHSAVFADLHSLLSSAPSFSEPRGTPVVRPLSYDLQLQFPLSEVSDPDVPLFTGRCVLQFELVNQIGLETAFLSDSTSNRARLKFDISMLDHFENVSLIFNGNELDIFNVLLTDDSMEISLDQPVLFTGRYTLTIHRYKGLIGAAIYYRDAGEHAAFGSSLYPNKAPAVFPSFLSATLKATFSISIIHPIGTIALTSGANDSAPQEIDQNWQITSFATTPSIAPSMLCFALLPLEYTKIDSSYTGINMTVHYNRYRIQATQAKHLLHTATQVLSLLKELFSSILPVAKIDIITMNDVGHSACFGALIVPEASFFSADYANQVQMLAMWLAKQWIGGLAAISEGEQMCLQEDLVAFIALKVTKRMTNDEHLRLSNLAKVTLTEDIFLPGETLNLNEHPNELEIGEKCGLKGVFLLESIEGLTDEKYVIQKINELVYNSKQGSYSLRDVLGLLNRTVDGDIYISQLLHFWRDHGGLPYMNVDRIGSTIKVTQDEGNLTVKNGKGIWERMPLWPLPLRFTEFKLPIQLMISQGVHLSPVRDGHIFANLGFPHFYRVNYDIDTWRNIKNILTENATLYTPSERFQLVSDFCHFYSMKALPEPAASVLRNEYVQLIRLRPTSFPICDAAIYQCVVTHEHTRPKHIDRITMIQLRRRVFESLTNASEMECRTGDAHDALNEVCTRLYGLACL
ncbi:unnamed protein product [Caenorhabditis bovis]|uniref:Aminopeptidase N-like N-terminal domain-containing protein n=1 Tax=Caenorhabditis bovis TaxID=2654633 RepID=A0A8S1EPR9_9PELO|nr:unnamed protein product [Caenorhabditis bovis]